MVHVGSRGFCPLFDFGEEGRPFNDFSYFFPYLFYHRFLVSNCSKFCVKWIRMGSTVVGKESLFCAGCEPNLRSLHVASAALVQSSKTSAFSQRTAAADEGACEISFFENAYRWEKEELFTGFRGDKLPVVSYNMTMFETVPAETQRLQAIWRRVFCWAYRCQSIRSRDRMST